MQHGILNNRLDDNNLLPQRVRLGNANRFVYPEVRVSKLNARYKDSFDYRFLTMERVALIDSYTLFLNVHRSLYRFIFLLNDILFNRDFVQLGKTIVPSSFEKVYFRRLKYPRTTDDSNRHTRSVVRWDKYILRN